MVTGASPATSAGGGAVGREARGGYGVPERERRGGGCSEAHVDDRGMDGELGEGRAATNLTTAILGSRRGGKHRGGAPGLFRSCGSVRGLVTRRRSSGAARGIVGTAVVAATANGGGGRVRWRVRERDRGGERGRGRERGGPGVEEECVATSRASGRRGGEAGRVVAWRARRRRGVPPLPTGRGRR